MDKLFTMDNMDEQYEDGRKEVNTTGAAVTCQRWYGFFYDEFGREYGM